MLNRLFFGKDVIRECIFFSMRAIDKSKVKKGSNKIMDGLRMNTEEKSKHPVNMDH